MPVTITTKRLDEVQTVKTSQRDEIKQALKSPTSSLTFDMSKIPSKKVPQIESRKTSVTKIQMSSSAGNITPVAATSSSATTLKAVRESNYTPSISSIGSVLLRSKTADFERILSDQNTIKPSARINQERASPANPNVTNINISLKTSAKKKQAAANDESEKRLPIYKRQEIISSVQKKK